MSRLTVVWACALLGLCGVTAWAEEKKKPDYSPIEAASPTEAAAEANIQQALDEKTDFDFNEAPLSDAVEFIRKRHKIEVQLDLKALEDASIGPDTPVTRKLSGISLRSALRLTLGALDLAFIIRSEVLMITTPYEAANEVRTKVYPVGDLTSPNPPELGGEDFQQLIDAIRTSVAATSWDEVGGPGTIMPVRETRSLVISQTDELHEEIAKLLAALRRGKQAQTPAPRRTVLGTVVDRWLNAVRNRAAVLRSLGMAHASPMPE